LRYLFNNYRGMDTAN